MRDIDRYFTNAATEQITRARQDHLASLGLDLSHKRVLEVGAGIGMHTPFFISRGCDVVVTDGNPENVESIKRRLPNNECFVLDLEQEDSLVHLGQFDIVYAYGLFYHLGNLESAIRLLSEICTGQMLIETRVSVSFDDSIEYMTDHGGNNGSICRKASRPSRLWVMNRLAKYLGHAYTSVTQPNHEDFPLNWNLAKGSDNRAIFVASKVPLVLPALSETLPEVQDIFI